MSFGIFTTPFWCVTISSENEPTLANWSTGLPFQVSRVADATFCAGSLQRCGSPRRQ